MAPDTGNQCVAKSKIMEKNGLFRTYCGSTIFLLALCLSIVSKDQGNAFSTPHYHHVGTSPELHPCVGPHGSNRRRRTNVAVSSAEGTSTTRTDDHVEKSNDGDDDEAKCPFTMSYQRCKINLTRGSSNNDKGLLFSGDNDAFSIVSNVQRAFVRTSLRQGTYKKDVLVGGFRWEPYHRRPTASRDTDGRDHRDLFAAAAFWRAVADSFSSSSERGDDQSRDDERLVLALPDSSFETLRGLVEILEWYNDQIATTGRANRRSSVAAAAAAGSDDSDPVTIVVDAEIDFSASVPVVVLTTRRARIERRRSDGDDAFLDSSSSSLEDEPRRHTTTDATVVKGRIMAWVKRLLVDESICPFTKSVKMSGQGLSDLGVQPGSIAYHTSGVDDDDDSETTNNDPNVLELMADAWSAVLDMMEAGPSGREGVSSILLAAPAFDADFELWAGPVFAMLEVCVGACRAEPLVGLVCFHPEYKVCDGTSWPGFGHMHSVQRLSKWTNSNDDDNDGGNDRESNSLTENDVAAGGAWQRRTPHAVINVLRADQLEVAEGRRDTPTLYARNIRVLVEKIGLDRLQKDLDNERALS